ncbi:uncharacterized protein RAG0_01626 [Rhynchosporium agropyri]|uniref:Uncharacterized protein n=1 Tax=Rhynchosporium agropyri TaxID=914238 RepID=A0A1E1JXZ5_9HELO|nr:uncharacterized protein RAG0_01626 [Rhynchosporium agropyri]
MSARIKLSEIGVLVKLAWKTVEEARKLAGEHDELTNEVEAAYLTLDHLKSMIVDQKSVINKAKGGRRKDLENHIRGCRRHLRRINSVLITFGATQYGIVERRHRVLFGNGAVRDVSKNRLKLSKYVSVINMTLHLLSLGHQGSMERELSHQRGEAKRLRASINLLLAKRTALARADRRDESVSSNSYDDKEHWRTLMRELVDQGFGSGLINGNKRLIKAYVKELEQRGVITEGVLGAQPPMNSFPFTEQAGSDRSGSTSTHNSSILDDFDALSIAEDNDSKSQHDSTPHKNNEVDQQQRALQQDSNRFEDSSIVNEKVSPDASYVPTRASVSEIEAMRCQETSRRAKRSLTPSPLPPPKRRSPLSALLFPTKQKSKRASQAAEPSRESRKRQKRVPLPPRPSSPTPPPPAWWLEERLRRRPPGYERGRSPPPTPLPSPPRYAICAEYSRTIYAYPENNYRWQTAY